MQITGYKIREALKAQELLKEQVVAKLANNPLWATQDEVKKPSPDEVMSQYTHCERMIAKLQGLQAMYNSRVKVAVQGDMLSLGESIKLIGCLGRVESAWRNLAQDIKESSNEQIHHGNGWLTRPMTRLMPSRDVVARAGSASKKAAALRSAVAEGNGTKLDLDSFEITGLDPKLFD